MSAEPTEGLAERAAVVVRARPGIHASELASRTDADEASLEWALYRNGRRLGLGQDFAGCWWHYEDNAEITARYAETGGAPSLRPLSAEPDWR